MAVGDKIVIANKSEMLLDFDNVYSAFGYTKELKKSDRFEETDTPYVIEDKGGDAIRFTKGLVNRDSTENIYLPLAPFADGSGDEVLSHSDNGFATQSDHKAEDIIHCGNGDELVANGTFDSNTDGWAAHNCDSSKLDETAGLLTVDDSDDAGDYSSARTNIDVVAGVSYLITVNLFSESGEASMFLYHGADSTEESNGIVGTDVPFDVGRNTYVFNCDTTETITVALTTGGTSTSKYDSISIKPVEQTYQTTTSTTAGDLVTDSTKFSKINFISRQDVIFIGEDGKHKTIKGYHNFSAGFSVDDVANAYGCTKVGKGLFSVTDLSCVDYDGTEITYTGEITAISLVSRLNAKMYDVVHNPFGSRKDSDDKFWYEVDNQDTYSTLLKDVNSTSGRPDNKLEDKVYFEGLGGLIFRNTLAVKPNKKDLLEDETNKLVGIDEISEECGVVTDGYFYTTSGDYYVNKNNTPYNLSVDGGITNKQSLVVGDEYKIQLIDKTTPRTIICNAVLVENSVNPRFNADYLLGLTDGWYNDKNYIVVITKQNNQLLQQGK